MYSLICARFITGRAWSIHQGYNQQLLNLFPTQVLQGSTQDFLPELTWFFCHGRMARLPQLLSAQYQSRLFIIVFSSGAGNSSQLALVWLLRNQSLPGHCVDLPTALVLYCCLICVGVTSQSLCAVGNVFNLVLKVSARMTPKALWKRGVAFREHCVRRHQ